MEVRITRDGGFLPGLGLTACLRAASLDDADQERLRRLVSLAGSAPRAAGGGPDAFRYTLQVEGDGASGTLHVNEAAASAELRSLLHWASQRGADPG